MALQCASSQILIRKSGSFLKFANRDYMSPRTRLPLRLGKAPPFILTTSASIDKVYENESEGIVCYKDESTGEIICEGYDEGPRLQRIPAPTFPPRDAEIMNLLLQQSLLQIVKGKKMNLSLQRLCLHQHFNFDAHESFCSYSCKS
ncbi:uncharacterized protein LOC129288673 isoform X2 [Prosopis cineraria]|uniref:uncharacterized protein LOC129288673 isoform X2 n=1 Tax=Prosopis cineraria TaxID=364024 RepID=UPI00240F68F1|nr:uncharacterized protein LOC129288673 isoform X2 [Prosopis cineraria]